VVVKNGVKVSGLSGAESVMRNIYTYCVLYVVYTHIVDEACLPVMTDGQDHSLYCADESTLDVQLVSSVARKDRTQLSQDIDGLLHWLHSFGAAE